LRYIIHPTGANAYQQWTQAGRRILVGELIDDGFPIPWLSVTYHFGPQR
jgi:hypothetical protein